MALLRKLLGTGLISVLGLSVAQFANAQSVADTEYAEMSRPAITQVLKKKTAVLTDLNFQREVVDYDGAVIVLFDSTCNRTQEADNIDKNMDIVYLGLIDQFSSARVNNLPLKFTYFDGCNFYERPNGLFAQLGITTTETHMYLDGRKIDVMRGGPISEKGVRAFDTNMSLWIEYTLLGIRQPEDRDRDIVALYKETMDLEVYPSSEIQK